MITGRSGTAISVSASYRLNRREFIKKTAAITGGLAFTKLNSSMFTKADQSLPFKISLAEWSLHRTIRKGDLDHLDFAAIAKNEFGIDAIEYVNSFFFEKAQDRSYLKEMRSRCDDLGVKSLLIMCDNEGNLGDPDEAKRMEAVENHYKWAEAAKYLGCHSIRVNARSSDYAPGSWPENAKKLNSYENQHGGLSSNGKWLAEVMEKVDHPRVGTLPDFGNFRIEEGEWYDRYQGVQELMPYAKAVSAKSHQFDDDGNEINTDFYKMMNIVLDAGYNGYVGIEYEGSAHSEMDGIRLTHELLKNVRTSNK